MIIPDNSYIDKYMILIYNRILKNAHITGKYR